MIDTDRPQATSPTVDINRAAPAAAEAEIEIDAEPERVWETLVNVEGWPQWNPDVKSVSLQGGAREGSVFRWKTTSGTITSAFQTVQSPHHVSWTGKTMTLRAIHVWSIQQTGGKTAESFEGLLARLLRRPLNRMLQKTLDKTLEALKVEVERRSKSA
jgi:uncharacterized protein YndB with AHSA1/START domain